MKNILSLAAIIVTTAMSVNAQSSFNFVSKQNQQVKYDVENKMYFVDAEAKSTSKIRVKDNAVYFMSTDGTALVTTKVLLPKAELESIADGNSFSVNNITDNNGNIVKVSFWFIDGVLDEVSYTNESTQVTIAYKDITTSAEENAVKAVASTKGHRANKLN